MNRHRYLNAFSLLCVASIAGTVHAHGGGGSSHAGGGGHGSGGTSHASGGDVHGHSFHGAGDWHGRGGIAGGGWHGGGLNGIGVFPSDVGHAGYVGSVGGAGFGHDFGHLPNAGFNGGSMGRFAGWNSGFSGHGAPLAGVFPGGTTLWTHGHPYSWYNGHWHNHWSGSGFGGYGGGWGYPLGYGYPIGWGVGGWGVGSLWYNSGYSQYYNPYYNAAPGAGGGWSYAQPIPMANVGAVAANGADPNLPDAGNPDVDAAVERFEAGDYTDALAMVDRALQGQPSDGAAHELRALILFAKEDYSQAAATIHSVLAVGPGWNWTTLSSLYPDMQRYTAQLAALENYVNIHPRQADARFLLAYHYMTAGHTDAAAEQLAKVVDLMPNDKLAADLLRMVGGGQCGAPPPAAARPPSAPTAQPIDPAALVGFWHASRDDGSKFDLELTADKAFTWKFSQQQRNQTISGTYHIDDALLILQGDTGGSMVGQVSTDGGDRFTFKPVGAPPDDAGLTFTR